MDTSSNQTGLMSKINGYGSDHLLTLGLAAIWGLVTLVVYYLTDQMVVNFAITFLFALLMGFVTACLLGWIVKFFTKNDRHFHLVANWYLMIGILIRVGTYLITMAA